MIAYATVAYVTDTPSGILDDLHHLSPSAEGDGAVLLDIHAAIDMARGNKGLVRRDTLKFLNKIKRSFTLACDTVFFTN